MDITQSQDSFRRKIFSFTYEVVPFVIMEFTCSNELFELFYGDFDALSPSVKEVIVLILLHEPRHHLVTNARIDDFECFKSEVSKAVRIVFNRGYNPGYFLKFCARLCFLALVSFVRDVAKTSAYASLSLNILLNQYRISNQFTEDSWEELNKEAKEVIKMCKICKPEVVIKAMGEVEFRDLKMRILNISQQHQQA